MTDRGCFPEADFWSGIRSGRHGQRRPRTSGHRLGQERGRILGMGKENPVLVLASGDDPQFAMLNELPHTVCGDVAACAHAGKDATVILLWSSTRELLRELFAICSKVRWVHSRAAGLDNLLFPELVESQILLTNGRGVFSASLGEFVLAAILYFAKDFRRMVRNQTAAVWEPFDVQEIGGQTVGILGYGDIGRAVASRVRPMNMRVLATKRGIDRSASGALLQAGGATGDDRALRLHSGDGSIDRGDAAHDQRRRVRGDETDGGSDQCGTRAGH